MKKIFTLLAAVMTVCSLSAENYFLKSTWGQAEASWKQMTEDDGSYILPNDFFDGKAIAINTVKSDEGARIINPENIQGFIDNDFAALAAGDSAMFVYNPDEYSQYDPKASGLMAIINWKKGYAFKAGDVWADMTENEGDFVTANTKFEGKAVQIAHENEIKSIKPANIQAFINNDFATLSAGDSAMFIFNPEMYNQYNEKESGTMAIINWKNGYAIKYNKVWENMIVDPKDADWWTMENVILEADSIQIVNGNEIRAIKAENINAYINYDAAELTVGDSVMFIYRPSEYNRYNVKESGMQAFITKKNGYAIRGTWGEKAASWKNLKDDEDGGFFVENVLFDGQNVQVMAGAAIYDIKPENIKADDYSGEEVELEAGDIVLFSFVPDTRSAYDETKSGLWAVILKKHGYALENSWGEGARSWKEMVMDTVDWYILDNVMFEGRDVAINNFAGALGARTIYPKNINAFINGDFAELSSGDSVLFIYRPSLYNRYNEKESGLQAIINNKAGYAIKIGDAWKNMTMDPEDADWWTLENVVFDGKDIQIVIGNEIRTIKPENIEAYINYDFAELTAGDTVTFVYRPSLVNRYNEKESGLYAHITKKNGYAILGNWGEKFASWKNMIEQDSDTYVIDSVVFEGKDVQFVSNEGIRTIKVENIKAYLLPDYEEATLAEGDLIAFMYTPSEYNHYDETQSGLSAIILEKNQEGIENIAADGKAVKVVMNGQMFIIKNGKVFDVMGTLVK